MASDAAKVGKPWRRRSRAVVACRKCHLRKVRCSLATSGSPCFNCQQDGATCQVLPRKKVGAKRKPTIESESVEQRHGPDTQSLEVENSVPLAVQLTTLQRPQHSSMSPRGRDSVLPTPNTFASEEALRQREYLAVDEDDPQDARRYALDLDVNPPPVEEQKPAPIYVGDQHGLGRFIFDLCNGPSQAGSHFLVPRVTTRTQKPEDLAYLRLKGAFSIPSRDVCEDLFRCYFHYVHPFLPIIDVKHFLEEFENHGCRDINLLLLWSMFLATSNFVEPIVLQKAGYATRKAMKRAMYQRAKCLYDSDYEEDKTALIQSVILMTFWYSDTEDRTGAWHWMGIAISLCQTLGLHRNPESGNSRNRPSKHRISLWCRIWWCCFANDRWLSLTMGRPMRINPQDCEMPKPCVEDVTDDLLCLPASIGRKYLPVNAETLAALWVNSIRIGDTLGTIIRSFYTPEGTSTGSKEMERCEKMLIEIAPKEIEMEQTDMISLFHAYQLQLFYETTVIVLHRPSVLRGTVEATKVDGWQQRSRQKAKTAATNINNILEKLIDLDMIKFLKPMSIPGLTAAMQIHLSEYTSPNPLARRLGRHKLEFLMMVLSELRGTYWGANFWYALFERALAKMSAHQTKAYITTSSEDDIVTSDNAPFSRTAELTSGIASDQYQIADSNKSLDEFLDPNLFVWGSPDPFYSSFEDHDMSFTTLHPSVGHEDEANGTSQSLMGPNMMEILGLNSLLSFEEFNVQCLEMAQTE